MMRRRAYKKPTSALDEIMRENLKKKPKVERSRTGSTMASWSSA